jgi:hypothetical protein
VGPRIGLDTVAKRKIPNGKLSLLLDSEGFGSVLKFIHEDNVREIYFDATEGS